MSQLINYPDAGPTTFIGADYSAAKSRPNPTWLAVGRLEVGEFRTGDETGDEQKSLVLQINHLENIGSDRLAAAILGLQNTQPEKSIIAGLDFPFSWPVAFLDFVAAKLKQQGPRTTADFCEIVAELAALPFDKVEELAGEFGREPRRLTDDLMRPKGQSPLHRINPGMLKMTWQGTGLLAELRGAGFSTPPIDIWPDETDSRHIALEVYPAAILRMLSLPFQKYKGAGPEARERRRAMVVPAGDGYTLHTVNSDCQKLPRLSFGAETGKLALKSDDALDAALACFGAAIASLHPRAVRPETLLPGLSATPFEGAEGWIYSPYSLAGDFLRGL